MSVTNIPNFVILKNTDKFYKNIYEKQLKELYGSIKSQISNSSFIGAKNTSLSKYSKQFTIHKDHISETYITPLLYVLFSFVYQKFYTKNLIYGMKMENELNYNLYKAIFSHYNPVIKKINVFLDINFKKNLNENKKIEFDSGLLKTICDNKDKINIFIGTINDEINKKIDEIDEKESEYKKSIKSMNLYETNIGIIKDLIKKIIKIREMSGDVLGNDNFTKESLVKKSGIASKVSEGKNNGLKDPNNKKAQNVKSIEKLKTDLATTKTELKEAQSFYNGYKKLIDERVNLINTGLTKPNEVKLLEENGNKLLYYGLYQSNINNLNIKSNNNESKLNKLSNISNIYDSDDLKKKYQQLYILLLNPNDSTGNPRLPKGTTIGTSTFTDEDENDIKIILDDFLKQFEAKKNSYESEVEKIANNIQEFEKLRNNKKTESSEKLKLSKIIDQDIGYILQQYSYPFGETDYNKFYEYQDYFENAMIKYQELVNLSLKLNLVLPKDKYIIDIKINSSGNENKKILENSIDKFEEKKNNYKNILEINNKIIQFNGQEKDVIQIKIDNAENSSNNKFYLNELFEIKNNFVNNLLKYIDDGKTNLTKNSKHTFKNNITKSNEYKGIFSYLIYFYNALMINEIDEYQYLKEVLNEKETKKISIKNKNNSSNKSEVLTDNGDFLKKIKDDKLNN